MRTGKRSPYSPGWDQIVFERGDEPRIRGWSLYYLAATQPEYMQDYKACLEYEKTLWPNAPHEPCGAKNDNRESANQ